jgi:hypothetical protein
VYDSCESWCLSSVNRIAPDFSTSQSDLLVAEKADHASRLLHQSLNAGPRLPQVLLYLRRPPPQLLVLHDSLAVNLQHDPQECLQTCARQCWACIELSIPLHVQQPRQVVCTVLLSDNIPGRPQSASIRGKFGQSSHLQELEVAVAQ